MSWFQELAGKAENILTKIDENAKTVLQTNGDDVVKETQLLEVKTIPTQPFPRIPSSKALSLIGAKSTPKKRTQKFEDDGNMSVRSYSSRSSVHDGSVIEVENASSSFEIERPSISHHLNSSDVPMDKELSATKILVINCFL